MLRGQESGFRTNGNGNIQCREPIRKNIPGEMFGDPMPCRCQTRVEPCAVLTM